MKNERGTTEQSIYYRLSGQKAPKLSDSPDRALVNGEDQHRHDKFPTNKRRGNDLLVGSERCMEVVRLEEGAKKKTPQTKPAPQKKKPAKT